MLRREKPNKDLKSKKSKKPTSTEPEDLIQPDKEVQPEDEIQPENTNPEIAKKPHKIHFYPQSKSAHRRYIVIFATFVALLAGACAFCYFTILDIFSEHFYDAGSKVEEKTYIYDSMTGLEITDNSINSAPVYCIQIPNGTDGARSQSGLSEAAVVFEAIAEAGITRFAAIFRNPQVSAIGPIRSLRLYYLQWDTPFDCSITHAGGAADAIAALRAGGYKDLTENNTYMYRSAKNSTLNRRWNNLFTTTALLGNYANATGRTTSSPKVFPRHDKFTAREARDAWDEAVATYTDYQADPSAYTTAPAPATYTTSISFRYGNQKNFNPVYTYDKETNTYLRAYESGTPHTTYHCDKSLTGKITPETTCGQPIQLAPSVVIGMIVQEKKAADNYHESITTTGTGKAYIFQNGQAIEGTWEKPSVSDQITFRDSAGEPITFMPGQIWISAIPQYGAVSYK